MTIEELTIRAGRKGITGISFDAAPGGATDGSTEALVHAQRGSAQLREYLSGDRTDFDLTIDLDSVPGLTPFRRAVLQALREIPYGETVSYSEVAATVGSRSARAVGQAVGWNPFPVLIPCHRVIAADGGLGGYSGGLHRKVDLLTVEGIRIGH